MLEVLQELKDTTLPMAFALLRITIIFWILPFLTETVMQGLVRNVFAFCMCMLMIPVVKASMPLGGITMVMGVAIACKEVFVGVTIGFLVSLPFWAMAAMGFMIDTQRGAFVASLFSPFFGARVSPLGTLLMQALTLLFFVSGGFLLMLKGLYQSYIFWPVPDFFPQMGIVGTKYFAMQFQWHVYIAVLLAAPISILLFIIDFAMGLINRFVPQLNVFFLSLPIKGVVAIFLLTVYVTSIMGYFEQHFDKMLDLFTQLDAVFT